MEKLLVKIDKQGVITYIYNDSLAALSQKDGARITRVSHVEPCEGGWGATMVEDGKFIGPFKLRSEALAAEVKYLEEKLFGKGLENGTTQTPA